ncbi:MAG: hypothetical protein JJ953_03595 [Gracilimonas sp.]|uniref:hypothetical protein n=1 Tax=Gracilimonas sp. TaxID=1974203 RepID=UPI001B034EDD|nr:hypothetical protein [Gracilimonas sp.]MBO6585171.1 hypothetical protein [Gracilimonas sp.]MBO6615557.1 hypothetical protein [Gracilimonas sp.]
MIRKRYLIIALLFVGSALSTELKAGTDAWDIYPPLVCAERGSEYYTIDLVTTKNVPGTGLAKGKAVMKFNPNPFGISITKDGSYQHRLDIKLNKVNKPQKGTFVAWVTTPSLDKVKLLGALDKNLETSGTVDWNKYIVVITLEEGVSKSNSSTWSGPIAFRGLSRSGLMHTMAGHGPFAQEPCAKYGYY